MATRLANMVGQNNERSSYSGRLALNLRAKRDPTRTSTLRNRFVREVNKRFNTVKRDIRVSIIDRDCFGIQPDLILLAATRPREFAFKTTEAKIKAFIDWLEQLEESTILEILDRASIGNRGTGVWTDNYITQAYLQGVNRARAELLRRGYDLLEPTTLPRGINVIFSNPAHAERVALMYSRTFEDLKSVTQFTNNRIRRDIAEGLTTGLTRGIAEGKSPKVIAREIFKDVEHSVDKIGKVRARMIARTEVVNAHHKANIQEYRNAQVEGVTIVAEWLTAGDPCILCATAAARQEPYTLEEIEALIPLHPNCRCTAIPIVKVDKEAA